MQREPIYIEEEMIRIDKETDLAFQVKESISKLRVNLGFFGKDVKVIMITSSVANEGKSFISYNLWKSLAEAGKKVVLVDCDLRNSSIFKSGNMTFTGGRLNSLAHVLSEQVDLPNAVYSTNVENGYLLPSTSSVLNPGLLLSNGLLKKTLQSLRNAFDYVIVDTPPIRVVADPLQIAEYCDGSILIIQANQTKRNIVEESYRTLQRTGKPILGTVLNQMPVVKTPGYYDYYYGKEKKAKEALERR